VPAWDYRLICDAVDVPTLTPGAQSTVPFDASREKRADATDPEARIRAATKLRAQGQDDAADIAESLANPSRIWHAVSAELKGRVTPQDLQSFLVPCEALAFDENVLVVGIPNADVRDWPLHTFGDEFRPLLARSGLANTTIRFDVLDSQARALRVRMGNTSSLRRIHMGRAIDRWKIVMLVPERLDGC
jgi:hypothetical protein